MTAKISLPFRYPGTTFAIRERDRFNLASPYTNFRFDVDGGKDVVAMVDGLLSIRHPTDPSLPAALVLKPLLPHRLTQELPDRFAAARLLGIEQIIYKELPLNVVSDTACRDSRGNLRRVVNRRGIRTRALVNPGQFLEGRATIRVARNDRLFSSQTAFEFQVVIGLSGGEEPYFADIMTLLDWWRQAGMLASDPRSDPPIPQNFLPPLPSPLPPRLSVVGPRRGEASFTFDCQETLVHLDRPLADTTLIPPELVRIGHGHSDSLQLTIDPSTDEDIICEVYGQDGTREVLRVSRRPELHGSVFRFDRLTWASLPTDLQNRRHVDILLRRSSAVASGGIKVRAFRPAPDPRGWGEEEGRHPEEWHLPTVPGLQIREFVTGHYDQVFADPSWNAWAMQINAAGRHIEVWVQTRSFPTRSYRFSGDTQSRTSLPVVFSIVGEEFESGQRVRSGIAGTLTFQPSLRIWDAQLSFEGRPGMNFHRTSGAPRLSDAMIDAVQGQLRSFVAEHVRWPLTRAQVESCRSIVNEIKRLVENYYTNQGNRADIAGRINDHIIDWFASKTLESQRLLARQLMSALLAKTPASVTDFPSIFILRPIAPTSVSSYLRQILEVGDPDPVLRRVREYLGLAQASSAARSEVFHYRWKFKTLGGIEGRVGLGIKVMGGIIMIERIVPKPTPLPYNATREQHDRHYEELLWHREYPVVVVAPSLGPSVGASFGQADFDWDELESLVRWTPEQFVGLFFVGELSWAALIEETTLVGGAMFLGTTNEYGIPTQRPLIGWSDGHTLLFGMEIGAGGSLTIGRIYSPLDAGDPRARLPELLIPAQVLTPIVHSQHYDYATREARLTSEGWSRLRRLLAINLAAMMNRNTEVSIIGHASRLGSTEDNLVLSSRRAENAQRAIDDILGPISVDGVSRPRARIVDVIGRGEPQASFPRGANPDSPADRYVEILINGQAVLRLREAPE
jgi:hypothetical protein